MRTVTYGGAVSLDGFLAGPDGAIDWLHYSNDVQQIVATYWKSIDTILMGRKTYQVAIATEGAGKTTPSKARKQAVKKTFSGIRTYVFSRTLKSLDDPAAELVSSDAVAFVRALKAKPGKEICLMGGGELAQTLIGAGLVDKVGLNIHPILLGAGIPVFRDPGGRVRLELAECRPLDGGCIMANYNVLNATSVE